MDTEKQFYLFLVSFGGHKSTINSLKEYFRYHSEEGISHFFFLEYFLLDPLRITDTNCSFESAVIFCPFLERMIKEQQFIPNWEEIKKNINDGIDNLKANKINLLPRNRELERYFLEKPLQINADTRWVNIGKNLFDSCKKGGQISEVRLDDKLCKYSLEKFNIELEEIKKLNSDSDKKALIKERVVLIYPWVKNGSLTSGSNINMVGIPVTSNQLFYGYLLVGFCQSNNSSENANVVNIRETLEAMLIKYAKNFYLPALILCHHSFYEKTCFSKDSVEIDKNIPFLFKNLKNSNNVLEKKIHELWLLRENNKKNWEKSKNGILFSRIDFGDLL